MSDCQICAWLDTLDPADMKIPTAEDRARFNAMADNIEIRLEH